MQQMKRSSEQHKETRCEDNPVWYCARGMQLELEPSVSKAIHWRIGSILLDVPLQLGKSLERPHYSVTVLWNCHRRNEWHLGLKAYDPCWYCWRHTPPHFWEEQKKMFVTFTGTKKLGTSVLDRQYDCTGNRQESSYRDPELGFAASGQLSIV